MCIPVPASIKLDNQTEVPMLDDMEETMEPCHGVSRGDQLNLLGSGLAKMTSDEEAAVVALVHGTAGSRKVIMKVKGG